jgi:hypothetical protein
MLPHQLETGVYYYRRRMPWRSKGELTPSLRTRSFREAQWLATGLDRELLRATADVSETTEGKPDLQRIARDYLKRKLECDMERRHASPHRPVYNTPDDDGASSVADLGWVGVELQTARTELRERLYDHQRSGHRHAARLLKSRQSDRRRGTPRQMRW